MSGTSAFNIGGLNVFDCAGNYIAPAVAYLTGGSNASNCVSNTSVGCSAGASANGVVLELDLGTFAPVGRVDVYGVVSASGYTLGLYVGANGAYPILPPQRFTTASTQSFSFANAVCALQPGALAAATASTATQLTADFGAGMSSSIVALQSALSSVNADTLTTLAQQVSTLSSQIAAESATANGQITSTLTQLSSAVSTNAAGLGSLSSTVVAVSSTASSNTALISALRFAIVTAAQAIPSGGAGGTPSISTSDGSTLTVSSGNCVANDVCGATSFANTLKATLNSL